jgi:hypothetical protein
VQIIKHDIKPGSVEKSTDLYKEGQQGDFLNFWQPIKIAKIFTDILKSRTQSKVEKFYSGVYSRYPILTVLKTF